MRFKLVLRSRCPVRVLLTSTVVATTMVLAGWTADGPPPLPGNAGSIGSFIRNLLGSKSEDQPPVAQNEAPVEPSVPKAKSATSKPKHPAVAAAGAPPTQLRSPLAHSKTPTEGPQPPPKPQAGPEPHSPPPIPPPPLL